MAHEHLRPLSKRYVKGSIFDIEIEYCRTCMKDFNKKNSAYIA